MQVPCLLHLVVGLEVGIFIHRWISHFCTPFSNASATNPILPNGVSTGPNIDPLSLQILYLKMLYSEERSGFPWTEPCHRTVFSQIKELERENNCVMIFGSVNQRFVVLILTLGKRIRVGIKS